jgi:RNA polymerase sporulation-specific sigma factor
VLKTIIEFLKKCMFFTTSYSINVFPDPLSKTEEENAINKMLKGDKDARSLLIEHNLRLVAHIVKKYDNLKEDADDLISIGTIGLIKGIDSYSPNKNVKLTTYVAKCAENEILMYFRSNKKNMNNVSLNEPIGLDKDGNEITYEDVIKENSIEIIDDVYLKDNINLLKKYINVLNKREKKIIILRYGLLNNEEQTQKEIADSLHISRSYVSRIEKRALIKMLREFIKNNN